MSSRSVCGPLGWRVLQTFTNDCHKGGAPRILRDGLDMVSCSKRSFRRLPIKIFTHSSFLWAPTMCQAVHTLVSRVCQPNGWMIQSIKWPIHQWSQCSIGITGEGHGNPLQYSCLENPMDRGTWWATVHGVAKSQTRLKQLSTHMWYSFFSFWLTSPCMTVSRSIHVSANGTVSFLFKAE